MKSYPGQRAERNHDGRSLIALSVLAVSLAVFFRVPFLPTIGIDVGMSDSQLAAITATFAMGRLIIDLPAGRLADRVHPYLLMAVGLVVAGLGSFTLGTAGTPLLIYLAAIMLGVSSGLSNTSGLRFFSTASSADRRASSVSIYSTVLLVGQASGPPLAAVLASTGDWRSAQLLASVGLVLLAGSLLLGFVRQHRSWRLPSKRPIEGLAVTTTRKTKGKWIVYLIPLLMFGAFGTTIHTLVPIIGDKLGITLGSIGLALGIGGLFRFVAIVVGGQVADRIGRKAALVPALAISAVGVTVLSIATSYPMWLAATVAISMGSIAISVSATVIADLATPDRVGRDLARWRFTGDIGLFAVPLLLGYVFEANGSRFALIPLAIALAVTALIATVGVPETAPAATRSSSQSEDGGFL